MKGAGRPRVLVTPKRPLFRFGQRVRCQVRGKMAMRTTAGRQVISCRARVARMRVVDVLAGACKASPYEETPTFPAPFGGTCLLRWDCV